MGFFSDLFSGFFDEDDCLSEEDKWDKWAGDVIAKSEVIQRQIDETERERDAKEELLIDFKKENIDVLLGEDSSFCDWEPCYIEDEDFQWMNEEYIEKHRRDMEKEVQEKTVEIRQKISEIATAIEEIKLIEKNMR